MYNLPRHRLTAPRLGSALFIGLVSMPALSDSPAGQLMFVHGEAQITRGSDERVASRGDAVYPGDSIETGPAGSVQIRYEDGGTQAIKPDSHFTLERYTADDAAPQGAEQRTELVRGAMRAITGSIAELAPENVNHDTPVATLGIRGTSLAALHVPEQGYAPLPDAEPGTYLRVERGLVAIITEGGTRLAHPGDVFFAADPQQPPQLRPDAGALFDQLGQVAPSGATGADRGESGSWLDTTTVGWLDEQRTQSADLYRQLDAVQTEPEPGPEPEPDWIDYDPRDSEVLLSASDGAGQFGELYEQNVVPEGLGSYALDEGEITWGYWAAGTSLPDDDESLAESLAFISAAPDMAISDTLPDSALEALQQLPEGVFIFDWQDGTALVDLAGEQDPIPIEEGEIWMSQFRELELFLSFAEDMGELRGSADLPEDFSLEGVQLEIFGDSLFDGASLTGRYAGEDAEAIMAIIEAWNDDAIFSGGGVFERDN
ncbi:hypothetical protein BWR19_05415 [Halomonas sp. 1513]|nr:FecR domain-containing protein [Halomonas sp. 1513]APX92422.1 hypothetical protein BWR19_05415 [Halomonas sp. 1513]